MSTSFPKIPYQTLLLHWDKGADEVNRCDNTTRGAVADGMQALRGDLCSRGREQGGVSPRLDWTEPGIRALFSLQRRHGAHAFERAVCTSCTVSLTQANSINVVHRGVNCVQNVMCASAHPVPDLFSLFRENKRGGTSDSGSSSAVGATVIID